MTHKGWHVVKPQHNQSFTEIDHELFSVSPFSWFKKGSCQFIVKEFAQVLVNRLED